MSYIYY